MSCFIVNDLTITAIADGLRRYNIPVGDTYPTTGKGYADVAQALVDMNTASVNARYHEETEPRAFARAYNKSTSEGGLEFNRPYRLNEIFGAVLCYEYQTCEAPEWRESELRARLQYLKDRLGEEAMEDHVGPVRGEILPEE